MPKILAKVSARFGKTGPRRFSLVLILSFLVINVLWVKLDQRAPIIGDDPRWLQGTYELYQPLKEGNLQAFYETWQSLYVKNSNSFPRTPLFALLSVPTFLVFSVSEDNAIITNLIILAASSFILILLVEQFFPGKRSRWLLPLSVLLFNLLHGVFGFGRLYMSEILQTFFVLLLTLLMIRYRKERVVKNYAKLGVLWSLAILLRFIMPIYLLLPTAVFVIEQLRLKQKFTYYLKALAIFAILFLPLTLTWYGQNFSTYLQFANYTTTGELAEYTSLGPVWQPLTMLKYWYVIATWVFGWPFAVLAAAVVILRLLKERVKYLKKLAKKQWLLLLIPLPALVAATLSDNKTARYFLPVAGFWVIFVAFELNYLIQVNKRAVKTMLVFLLLLTVYPFMQSILIFLPQLPRTGLNYAAGPYDSSLNSQQRYAFFYEVYQQIVKEKGSDLKVYNTSEQTRFNEAELMWYGTERGFNINSLGEFSKYEDLAIGKEKIASADILIVETNPETSPLWEEKYRAIIDYALQQKDFVIVGSLELSQDNAQLIILTKI